MSELLDIFDSNMNWIGTADRDEVHKVGYWHKTFQGWIVRKRNGKAYVVVQKRDKHKKTAPDMLDITAAGHLLAGETPLDGVRELEEELGISIQPESLINLGIRISATDNAKKINKEFCHVYLLEHDLPLDQYVLQEDEVSGLVEIEVQDGLKLFTGAVKSIRCDSVFIEEGFKVSREIDVEVKDFIPRIDPYYLKIFIMAERYFEGKMSLSI